MAATKAKQRAHDQLDVVDRALARLIETFESEEDALSILHDLVAYLPVPVIVYSAPDDNRIVWANRCALSLFFERHDEQIKLAVYRCVGERIVDAFHSKLASYVIGQNSQVSQSGRPQMKRGNPDGWDGIGYIWDAIRFPVVSNNIGVVLVPQKQEWLEQCQVAMMNSTR